MCEEPFRTLTMRRSTSTSGIALCAMQRPNRRRSLGRSLAWRTSTNNMGSPTAVAAAQYGFRGVAVSARLAVNQEVRVRLPSDTLFARTNTSVLLGEPPASKTGSRGPNPRARAHVPMM